MIGTRIRKARFAALTGAWLLAIGVATAAPDPEANPVPKLLQNLDGRDLWVSVSAARSMAYIFGPGGRETKDVEKVKKALMRTLETGRWWELRKECADALGQINVIEAVDVLAAALDDNAPSVGVAAAKALGLIKTGDAIDALKAAVDGKNDFVLMAVAEQLAARLPAHETREIMITQFQEGSEGSKVAASKVMIPLWTPEESELLLAALEVENWQIHANAIRGLLTAARGGLEFEDDVYEQLGDRLGHPVANIADAAMDFLGTLARKEALRILIKQADFRGDGERGDTTWRNRTYALKAFYQMRTRYRYQGRNGTVELVDVSRVKPALPAIIRNLGAPTANVVNVAKNILYEIRNNEQMPPRFLQPFFVRELEEAVSLRLRSSIMEEMGTDISKDYAPRVAKVASASLVESIAVDTAWPLRMRSIALLGVCGDTSAIEVIAGSVNDDMPNVRQAAGTALGQLAELCTDDEKAKVSEILIPVIVNPPDWRKAAIAAGVLSGYPDIAAAAPLVKNLSHTVINVQEAASQTLASYAGSKDAELKAHVAQLLYEEIGMNSRSWEYGAPVLGALMDRQAIPFLVMILTKGEWRAQANAASSVSAIAGATRVKDKALRDALIKCSQSNTLQVYNAANKALRILAMYEDDAEEEDDGIQIEADDVE